MILRAICISILIFLSDVLLAQTSAENYYWIQFADKQGTTFSVEQPNEFLSQRAIDRRMRQNIAIDETDLPVSISYLDSLERVGFHLKHTSKWLNGCTVSSANAESINQLQEISFVKNWELTKPASITKSARIKFESTEQRQETVDSTYYGASYTQINQMNGLSLHERGYRGNGMQIAVLDNGFYNSNSIAAFDSLWINKRILGFRDFVSPGGDVFQEGGHGTNVLSCMGACIPEQLIGTAPDASYYLFRTEDDDSEYLIEEDNWVAGAEYADSIGADIINSSLGYSIFDDPTMDHTYADMNGQTTRVTRAANMASSKGMLVFNSVGNEGDKEWKYLIAPSDGNKVIGVGAVNSDGEAASFSSFGPASDGNIKPNVSAMGSGVSLISIVGNIASSNGTSFSSPLMAGMAASLWSAFPTAFATEIKEAIEKSGSLFLTPDTQLGYGIPNFDFAKLQSLHVNLPEKLTNSDWHIFPNPFFDQLTIIWLKEKERTDCRIQLSTMQGKVYYDDVFSSTSRIVLPNLYNLPFGVYFLKLISEKKTSTFKLIKR